MDMDLMPKLYMLLCCQELQKRGHQKARFRVVFWQDPLEDSFYEDFDLKSVKKHEEIFIDKIATILKHQEIDHCGGQYCDACNYHKRYDFIAELKEKGYKVMSGEEFLERREDERLIDAASELLG
jgi:hypothetical protein